LVQKGSRLENLEYRKKVLEYAYSSPAAAEELWILCKRDPLFYVNTFVWTYDPRLSPQSTTIPFITFDYQDEGLLEILIAILSGQDMAIEKSRDTGASWLVLLAYKILWTFYPGQSFRLVSRNEDLVDKTEDPDCLFWKLMFVIKHEPDFIMSEAAYNKTHLHLYNKINSSVIDGASTTGDVTRGGRCTSMMPDEFASVMEGYEILKATRDVTNCRIFNSTPKGAANAFYELTHNPEIKKLRFHWSQDPRKNQGLYTTVDGKPKLLDPYARGTFRVGNKEYFYPDDYPFILDGKLRSPWYDHQCKRTVNTSEIAQELDIDYLGSDYPFFDPAQLAIIEKETVRRPLWEGEILFDPDTCEFRSLDSRSHGRLQLWINPDVYGHIAEDLEVVIGVDIAVGTGASNSAITIANKKTREDIGEWACPHTSPDELAKVAVALAKYFNEAYLIWDAGGPGRIFGSKVKDLGYGNIYFRIDDKRLTPKFSDIPGHYFTRENKVLTLGELRSAIGNQQYTVRSVEFIKEARQYIHVIASCSVVHSSSRNTNDPTGARENHGDRVTAKALAWKVIKAQYTPPKEEPAEIPRHCYAARRKRYEQKVKQEADW